MPMLVLTNGLTSAADEGFLKLASSLVKRLKAAKSGVFVVAYERSSQLADKFIKINKFMLSYELIALCKKYKDLLYLPFPTRKTAMALRVFLLSLFAKRLRVVLVLKTDIGPLGRLLLRLSGAEILVFSGEAASFYGKIVGENRVFKIKTGVDTQRFLPVAAEKQAQLKISYGFDPNKSVILHVGHLNEGRNIRQLLKVSQEHQVLLVTSTLTKAEQDIALREELLSKPNIRIIDDYIADIEQVYQLSDVYFFPVTKSGSCIDVPLSCLEAAACGKPVVTTNYGEMREFKGKNGFYFIEDFTAQKINTVIKTAIAENKSPREEILAYDWDKAIDSLM